MADVQDAVIERDCNNMDYKEKKARIEQELIDTEESYLEGLHVLMNEFIEPIFEQKMIEPQYKKQIMCNIPQLISFHEQFLEELIIGPISKVFNKQSDYFKIYISYITQYQHILDIFGRFKNNKKLKMYLNIKRKQNKPLTNHLILPIQRIPRYMLLLSELKKIIPKSKKNEYNEIENALKKVEEICNEINEKQREIENMSQCLQISQHLKGLDDINIVEPQRKYIDHFIFKRKNDKKNRQFFVFNDIVIISNPKWEAKRVIKLNKFEAKKRPNMDEQEVMINIIGGINNKNNNKNKNYSGPVAYISCNDINEKDKHENVSNIGLFVDIITRYRSKLYINRISRKRFNKLSDSENLQNNLELVDLIREKEDEDKLKEWEKSSKEKGDKHKVLTMLGSEDAVNF